MTTSSVSHSRPRRGALRLTLRILGGGGAALGALVLSVFGVAEYRARVHHDVPSHRLAVPTDSVSIRHGARLAQVRFCTECHSAGLIGRVMADEPAIGRIAPPNLTNGRLPAPLTDDEWERAVRHGVRPDGSALRIMPSHEFTGLSDDDLGAIVAYARSLPASDVAVPATTLGPLLKVLDVAGQLAVYPASEIDHHLPHPARVVAEPTPAYGRYVASTCTGCHGMGLSGGKIPGTPPDFPPAANITPNGIGHYTLEDMKRLLRSGVRPDGSRVNAGMPWRFTQSLDDTEITAIYAYLRTVPAREYGNR